MRLLNPLMVGVVIYLATGDPGVPPCYRQLSEWTGVRPRPTCHPLLLRRSALLSPLKCNYFIYSAALMTLSEMAFNSSGAAIVKKGCVFNSFVTFTCLCLVLICLLQQIIFTIIELELCVCIYVFHNDKGTRLVDDSAFNLRMKTVKETVTCCTTLQHQHTHSHL